MASLCVIKCGVGSPAKNMENSENLTQVSQRALQVIIVTFVAFYLVTLTVDKNDSDQISVSYVVHDFL